MLSKAQGWNFLGVYLTLYRGCAMGNEQKAKFIYQEIIDQTGRYMSDKEFNWFIDQFTDRYNPIRLSMIIARNTGLRIGRVIELRFSDFTDDFSFTKTTQNKPSYREDKKGIVHIKTKPNNSPLGNPLIQDLKDYVNHRMRMGKFMGMDLTSDRLFPRLSMQVIRNYFNKIRKRKSQEAPWLLEVWCKIHYYDENRELLKTQLMYRASPYETRGYYATKAYEQSNFDFRATQIVMGHDKLEHTMRYTKRIESKELRLKIKKNCLDTLYPQQPTPLLIGQKRLTPFIKEN